MTAFAIADPATGLLVDLFAGGGGAGTGVEWAFQRPIDIAINHDAEALAMHRANHPHTRHLCANLREVNPREATGGKPVYFLWASPDCKHFSRAKGGKPLERAIRSLAWVVVRWAEETLPTIICVENVPEFQTWGPLGPDARPLPAHKGDYFRAWVRRLKRLGYKVDWREMVACDLGAPTSRKRFFVVARRDGLPIAWPEPTHGPNRPQPWRTAAECINWEDTAPSIFARKKPLAPKTLARIAKGVKRYVLEAAQPFIVVNTSGHAPADVDAPVPTVTTGKQHMLVGPSLISVGYGEREGQSPRVPGLDKPLGTIVAGGIKHALVAPYLTEHANGSGQRVFSANEPLRTQVAQVKGGHFALVAASVEEASAVWVAKHYGGVTGQAADKPLGAVTAVDHHSLVSASVLKMRGTNVGSNIADPLHTVSAQGQHHGLLCASITEFRSGAVGSGMDEPVRTITAGGNPKRPSTGNTKGLLCAHIERYYSLGGQLSDVNAPLPTATAKARFGLSTAHLTQFNGRSEAQPLDEPTPSVTSRDRFGLVDVALEQGDRYEQVRDFLRAHGVIGPEDEAEVDVDSVRCRIVDIGMRMFRPRELYRAMGFPDTYEIAPIHKGKPLTLTSQVRMCGNSVPPHMSYALAAANLPASLAGRESAEAV